jgi:hypothetical protein
MPSTDSQEEISPGASRGEATIARFFFLVPLLTSAAIHGIILIGALVGNPKYLSDYRLNAKADARHYGLEGRNIWLLGHFSRCSAEPYVPDMLRTPIYPVFAGFFEVWGTPLALYCAQAILNVISCGIVFILARRLFTPFAGFIAAMLMATDLMVAISAFEAMSEILFLFLTLLGVLILVPRSSSHNRMPSIRQCAMGGLVLAAAALTRPVGLYVPIIISAFLFIYAAANAKPRQGLAMAVSLLLCAAIPIGCWIARNKVVFDLPRLSTADAIMTVYFTGGGAYQITHGLGLKEAHDLIAREYDLPTHTETNNHWISDTSVKDMDRKLRAVQWEVLSKYPAALVQSCVMGILKSHVSHNVNILGGIWGTRWKSTSAGKASNQGRARGLLANDLMLIVAFVWQLSHVLVTWALLALGSYALLRNVDIRWPTLLIAGVLAYFLLTVAIVGKEAASRSRTPHMPLMYIVAGASALLFDRRSTE